MTDAQDALAEAQSAEVINAASVHAETVEKARSAQFDASLERGLENFFNRGTERKQFIETRNLPMICDDLRGVHHELREIKENSVTKTDFALLKQQSDLTNKIVLGAVSLILVAFMAAVVAPHIV